MSQRRFGSSHGNLQLGQYQLRFQCRRRTVHIGRSQQFIGARIQDDAVLPRRFLDHDEPNPRRRVASLNNPGRLYAFVPVQPKRHFAEAVISYFRNEVHMCAESRAADRLIRAFAAEIDAVPGAEQRFAGTRNAADPHGQSSCIAANHSNTCRFHRPFQICCRRSDKSPDSLPRFAGLAALTRQNTNVSFGLIRDFARNITLSRAEKPLVPVDLRRREFLIRFCQGAGATLIPATLWGLPLPRPHPDAAFEFHPHYRTERPLDATLRKVESGTDEFVNEEYADQIAQILGEWSTGLLDSPNNTQALAKCLAQDFAGTSFQPVSSRALRDNAWLRVHRNSFDEKLTSKESFLRSFQSLLAAYSKIHAAEFQITAIEAGRPPAPSRIPEIRTSVRYEIVASGKDLHREQRIGNLDLVWKPTTTAGFQLQHCKVLDETQARAAQPIFSEITSAALGGNTSYTAQLLHGSDYWRTVLDGASGIDIYGHNGVSVADIDNDGFDDLYICQPAGLPNRLFRNRGDGTFEDITEASGLGVLENSVCALFADFSNDGHQDAIVVRANGPLLFLNEGGRFRPQPDVFHFATPPQGTFTGAAVADYDRDGWLDIYFCLYAYYQGTGQYRYPLPYHDAENGPPNFLMRNNRDGTFLDVTAKSGLNRNNTRYSFCCAWSDFNQDGWPDLYVVNDFGRKNLYRNNGDGTFTDIAPQAGVEDVGAGMSVSWLDCDGDGAQDIYVGNMWTAAGVRISTQENFKPTSPPNVRALYQKHAMGNSLFRNIKSRFEDGTNSSGTGVGRWAWTGDTFDFDHDGRPDLYVVNGMVSGPSRRELNSFFWRQVVARSPDDAHPSLPYEQGWNAINELIRSDETWSGYERNMFYANNGDGTYSDVSGAVGLDFIEDGRSFALADFNHDGRLEVFLKNRNAPQLRILQNEIRDLPSSISFRLQGSKSNRDAIGAAITVESSSARQTRMVQAGTGFLCQHSKDVFFGLGNSQGSIKASIRWPSGHIQELRDLPLNHRIWVEEGKPPLRFEAFRQNPAKPDQEVQVAPESLPDRVETWLLSPVLAPEFSLPDLSGRLRTHAELRGQPALLNFNATQSGNGKEELFRLQRLHEHRGLQIMSISVDGTPREAMLAFARDQRISYPLLQGDEDIAAIYNILYRQLFDRHRDLTLPTSFLIDPELNIVKIYQGALDIEHVGHDFQNIPKTDADRLARALPFPIAGGSLAFGRNYLSFGALFFQRGYLDQAQASFQQALRDDPNSAEALYGIGSVYLNQNKNREAREAFERTVKLPASYPDTLPDAWNNLGVIATRENRIEDSVQFFQQAVQLSPNHLLSLDNLGNAYRALKRWDDARKILEHALAIAPEDAEANYSLGMVFAQTGDTAQAHEYLQRALRARPAYPEALNNLGVLYVVTKKRDAAVQTLEQCIRVAPSFDQAYINLARVYAIEGSREKARNVLIELLKQRPDHQQATQMLHQLDGN